MRGNRNGRVDSVGPPIFRLFTIPMVLFLLPVMVETPDPTLVGLWLPLAAYSFPQPFIALLCRYGPPWLALLLNPMLATRAMLPDAVAWTVLRIAKTHPLSPLAREALLSRSQNQAARTLHLVVAEAALRAAGGEYTEAAWRMEVAARLPHDKKLRRAQRVAQEWLIAAAAGRGDHEYAMALAEGAAWVPSPAIRSLVPILQAGANGAPPPRDQALRQLRYGRLRLASICWRSPIPEMTHLPSDVSVDVSPDGSGQPLSALAVAAAACAAWSAQPGVHPERMQAAARALDALLADEAVRAGIAERAATLGVRGADPIEDWVRGHVTTFAARMVRDRRLLHPGDSPTLAAAVGDAREALWAELRDQLTDLRRVARARAAEVAPPANASYMEKRRHAAALVARGRDQADGDWQRLGAFVRLCEALGGELPERRLVFAQVADLLMNYAVDTFNHRKQRAFGHAVFRWLLAYGQQVGNAETITLLEKNVRVGA